MGAASTVARGATQWCCEKLGQRAQHACKHGAMLFNALRASASLALLASLVTAAACGGNAPPATAPTTPAPTDTSAAAASAAPAGSAAPATSAATAGSDSAPVPTTWSKDLPKPQQGAFMKANVVPALSPAFKAHDATKYGDFGCKTCHGHPFADPHDFLPHLTFSGGAITQFKDKPEISKWMHEVVEPTMAKAMGQQPYDMKTNTGFGCKGCHTVDMK
jgi:hypothetical protein